MCQSSEDHHEVEYLMTSADYVVLSRIPFLRNLCKSQLGVLGAFTDGLVTRAA